MLKINKNKGISLIELMVAVSLGLILIFSMLAFYGVSQNNLAAYIRENEAQRDIRRIMSLISKDVENTGGFECAKPTNIFKNSTEFKRFPKNIISLGDDFNRKQIIFAHPLTEEHLYKSLGMIDIQGTGNNLVAVYEPIEIQAGCGQEVNSTIYIGTTLFENIPVLNDSEILTSINGAQNIIADSLSAYVAFSYVQARQEANTVTDQTLKLFDRDYYADTNLRHAPTNSALLPFSATLKTDNGDPLIKPLYQPSVEDGTVLFISNNSDNAAQQEALPFGKNEVDIFFGFSPEGRFAHVPDNKIATLKVENNVIKGLENGGWLNPFSSQNIYDSLVDKADISDNDATLINQALHRNSGKNMKTYPLKNEAIRQIRAVKFKFTFDVGTPQERVLTRVIRFKNTHLMRIGEEGS